MNKTFLFTHLKPIVSRFLGQMTSLVGAVFTKISFHKTQHFTQLLSCQAKILLKSFIITIQFSDEVIKCSSLSAPLIYLMYPQAMLSF